MRERVLIVEDDDAIRELVCFHMERAGFAVRQVSGGQAALAQLGVWRPELLIVDVLLPDHSGLDICRRVRERDGELDWPGIIVLTALGEEGDRIVGLEVGADDYVTKPFSPRELVARARAVLRRHRRQPDGVARRPRVHAVGDLEIDLEALHVSVAGRRTDPMTATEFRILAALAEHAGQVLGREQVIDRVWGPGYFAGPRTVDVHVRHIREKLSRAGSATAIETVRGFGYRMEAGADHAGRRRADRFSDSAAAGAGEG